jgi:hypothetical protein
MGLIEDLTEPTPGVAKPGTTDATPPPVPESESDPSAADDPADTGEDDPDTDSGVRAVC